MITLKEHMACERLIEWDGPGLPATERTKMRSIVAGALFSQLYVAGIRQKDLAVVFGVTSSAVHARIKKSRRFLGQ